MNLAIIHLLDYFFKWKKSKRKYDTAK
jgi:hypothetical protein